MDTATLIHEVYARRPIWDRTDPLHQSRDAVNRMWSEVARKCGVKRECARSKWKHLRDTFRSQLKKCQMNKPGDQWMWYKSLYFLADQMKSRESGTCWTNEIEDEQPPVLSKNEEGNSTDESNPIGVSILSYEGSYVPPQKRKAEFIPENDFPEIHTCNSDYQNPPTSEFQNPPTDYQNSSELQNITESDANYYFLLSLLPQMSSLPSTKQMLLRLKIQELVVKEVIANQPAIKDTSKQEPSNQVASNQETSNQGTVNQETSNQEESEVDIDLVITTE